MYRQSLSGRVLPSKKKPKDFEEIKNTDLEESVPNWDISMPELQVLYHKVRMDEYFDFKYPVFSYWHMDCIDKSIKRRIPWLYPDSGKFYYHPYTPLTYFET